MRSRWEKIIEELKKEVVPATGCTEPVSLAYASALANEMLEGEPIEKIDSFVSANLMKNGMGVNVPRTGSAGLIIATAAGAYGGDPKGGLRVLDSITEEAVEKANKLIEDGKVSVAVADVPNILYAEANVYSENKHTRVCIADSHTNVILKEKNGEILFKKEANHTNIGDHEENFLQTLTVKEIYEFSTEIPLEGISFMKEAVNLNDILTKEGLEKDYGLGFGRTMKANIDRGMISDDVINRILYESVAASDARMGGAPFPAMTNSGSGNQGIAATSPVTSLAKSVKASEEELIRAVTLSHLIAIYIHAYLPKLSALCAVATAGIGAGAAMTWLQTKDYDAVVRCIANMTGDNIGMICDGAANSCAQKVANATSSATRGMLLAIDGKRVQGTDGIVANDVDECIRNIGQLATEGMKETDSEILKIMLEKNKTN